MSGGASNLLVFGIAPVSLRKESSMYERDVSGWWFKFDWFKLDLSRLRNEIPSGESSSVLLKELFSTLTKSGTAVHWELFPLNDWKDSGASSSGPDLSSS